MKQGWITNKYGVKCHYVHDVIHNDNGPAVIYADGTKYWYKHGKLHREDGSSIEWADGAKQWWFHDKYLGASDSGYTQEKFEKWLRLKVFI